MLSMRKKHSSARSKSDKNQNSMRSNGSAKRKVCSSFCLNMAVSCVCSGVTGYCSAVAEMLPQLKVASR